MADGRDKLHLTHELRVEEAPSSLFLARIVERGIPCVLAQDWTTSASSLDELGEAVVRVSASDGEQMLLERDGALVFVSLYRRHIYAAAAGETREDVDALLAWLRERLPAPDPSATHEVTVNFWTYSRHGPQPSWRSISVPAWEEIEENYAAATRDGLASIMTDFEPSRAGQLILWHGKAGTGKTYALRALAWEWREWCEFHYIVDPDAFFGEHADYLMSVLLQPTQIELPMHEALGVSEAEIRYELHDENGREQKAWKLLMLEDTGELLTSDARALIGQGLSRFLNVVDGLIGQGLRVLALVTTNEEVRKLHPAVARPGRCAANIEFTPLTADEAAAWLARRGADERPAAATTLASLYATLQGLDEQALPVTGFAT